MTNGRARAYEDLYQRMSTEEEEKDTYRMGRVYKTEHLLVKEDDDDDNILTLFNWGNGDTTENPLSWMSL